MNKPTPGRKEEWLEHIQACGGGIPPSVAWSDVVRAHELNGCRKCKAWRKSRLEKWKRDAETVSYIKRLLASPLTLRRIQEEEERES